LDVWGPQAWAGLVSDLLSVRGVIGYHPLPRIRSGTLNQGNLTLQWDGPSAILYDSTINGYRPAHGFVVEMAHSLLTRDFAPISPVVTNRTYTVTNCPSPAFFRIKLVQP